MKRRTPSYENADRTLAFGEAVATVMSEKREQLGVTREDEVLLRASIAAATFSTDRYMAALADAGKSPVAFRYLRETKQRCDESLRQLRRRVTRSLGQRCRYMSDRDLDRATGYLLIADTQLLSLGRRPAALL